MLPRDHYAIRAVAQYNGCLLWTYDFITDYVEIEYDIPTVSLQNVTSLL